MAETFATLNEAGVGVTMPVDALRSTLRRGVENRLDKAAKAYLGDPMLAKIDFAEPQGEAALVGPDSVSWRIFKNPVTLFVGGVAAVILEFAEPRVRTGVWDNTTFRTDPVRRLKRTGLAAMVTVYGAKSVAEKMIGNVNRMHDRVAGVTPDGSPYAASDPELLRWVQATAAFGFMESYSAYAAPLSDEDRDRYYAEGRPAALLYGANGSPRSLAEERALFEKMMPKLEASEIIFEFLNIMKRAEAFPQPAQLAQHSLVRAAVDIVPKEIREILGLTNRYGLRPFEGRVVRRMARRADRLILRSSPAVRACKRLGLPEDYLYRR
ncbi:oxygenase MpaB family protein [Hyphococcus flavus]|uniref:Oxygenase MpaB family protein n=1 Tax=Hyphococcus flavus TaxID=1866326 RepID=A0AAE9ZB21_9PROT|nr:oxygenase MpaB family protein [Hyphococcus flavus]WDI31163.1 oxygenase MpaB family protein [Hyphococcus flavus]